MRKQFLTASFVRSMADTGTTDAAPCRQPHNSACLSRSLQLKPYGSLSDNTQHAFERVHLQGRISALIAFDLVRALTMEDAPALS